MWNIEYGVWNVEYRQKAGCFVLSLKLKPCGKEGNAKSHLSFGFWVLGFGFWVLGFESWVLGFGFFTAEGAEVARRFAEGGRVLGFEF